MEMAIVNGLNFLFQDQFRSLEDFKNFGDGYNNFSRFIKSIPSF